MTSQPVQQGSSDPLELWAGIECSVVRVGDRYHDQLERNGHATRVADLDRIAGLGVRTLRYPILWERTAPLGLDRADWTWSADRLRRLQDLAIRPIVGLVHHGSGPRHTSLVDPSFAEGLAEFAREVARRQPWVKDFTPCNEPLTTARFSGLYGHWYPHARDDRTFAQALLTQCRATVLAMRAIRTINPAARLVQTDDLGKTFSTPTLSYQADFENERRWLTFDLLCGRVDRGHPLWGFLRWVGIAEADLGWFLDNPCPPDLIGLNYYPTSERFLDPEFQVYPPDSWGGNGRHAYADVAAVRVVAEGPVGPLALLSEAWKRYRLPLAITEVHLGCTREEQLRWLVEVWDAAQLARDRGIDVRAVTAWAVLGSFDWANLVTKEAGRYEPGAFDLSAGEPRPTALAKLIHDLATGRTPDHPVLGSPGWWHRPERILYPRLDDAPRELTGSGTLERRRAASVAPPILILGEAEPMGRAFARAADLRGLHYRLVSRRNIDTADGSTIEGMLDGWRPWAVIDAGGLTGIAAAERDSAACFRANVEGPAALASACARRGTALIALSKDLVFGGDKQSPYRERDAVAPLNVLGSSKVMMEAKVLAALPSALIIRTGVTFGLWDRGNFVSRALTTLAAGRPFIAASDLFFSPSYLPDLVQVALDLLIDGEAGIWHLAGAEVATWADLAARAARLAGLDYSRLETVPASRLGLGLRLPAYCALATDRGASLPGLDDSLRRYLVDGADIWDERGPRAVCVPPKAIGEGRTASLAADLVPSTAS